MKPDKTFKAGVVLGGHIISVAESLDAVKNQNYTISTIGSWNISRRDPWLAFVMEGWDIVSLATLDSLKIRAALDIEGQINLYDPNINPDRAYQLPDAGIWREGAIGYGYVNRIRAIGNSFYVCGQSRQVYRFVSGSPGFLDGQWADFAGSMRQPPISDPPDDPEDREALDRWLDENNAVDLVDIDGSAEDDIYAAGDECWHYDGQQWRRLELLTDESINAIKVISRDEVVMVGHNGIFLRGNAKNGFRDLSNVDDNQNFTGIEFFDGRFFLASNHGLFTYDPAKEKTEPNVTTLIPDLKDTHTLEAKEGVLWSFGRKDLAYFDGKVWTRVDHPDNPPIRA